MHKFVRVLDKYGAEPEALLFLRMTKKPKSLGPRMEHHKDFCVVKSTSWPFSGKILNMYWIERTRKISPFT